MNKNMKTLMEESNSFDAMHFDSMHLDVTKNDFDNYHLTLAQLAKTNPTMYKVVAPLVASIVAQQQKGGNGIMGQHGMDKASIEGIVMSSDAAFYIAITRATAAIVATNTVGPYTAGSKITLPFVLFGYNDFQSNYSAALKNALSVLQQACPGIQLAITKTGGTLLFTYTYNAAVDIVSISYAGTLTNYINILQNQSQDANSFYSRYINYSISDATNGQLQITTANIQFIDISSGGSQVNNELLVNSVKFTWDYQTDRVNVLFPQTHFNANLAVVDSIIPCPAVDVTAGIPFIVTYNMFINKHESHRAKK